MRGYTISGGKKRPFWRAELEVKRNNEGGKGGGKGGGGRNVPEIIVLAKGLGSEGKEGQTTGRDEE